MQASFYDMPEVQRNRWKIFVSVILFTFMATIDGSIVNIALPTIAKDLNINMNKSIWVVAIYMIAICTLLILFGKLGDIIGKIKIFRIGTVVFVIGSFLSGFSTSLEFLIGSRILQAVGAAMTMSTNLGILTEVFKLQDRGKALGFVGSAVSLGSITGPSVGGIIVHYLSWSYIFWLNIPFGLLTIYLGAKYLPKDISKTRAKMDFMGFYLYAAFVIIFFGTMFAGQEVGFEEPIIIALIALSMLCLAVFIKYELRKSSPLLELSIFKNRPVTIGLVCANLVFMANFFFAIITPFYLQNARGYSASAAGFIMMLFPIVMVIAAPIAGSLTTKIRAEKIAFAGLLVIASMHAMLFFINIDTNIFFFSALVGLGGLGNAMFQAPNNTIIMSSVDKKYLGVIGSLNALARNSGNVMGVTFATTILFTAMSLKAGGHITTYIEGEEWLFMFGMHTTFIISFSLLLVAAGLSLRQMKRV